MKINQEQFEQQIIELCQKNLVGEIEAYLKTIEINLNRYSQPIEDFIRALSALDVSSEKKESLIDQIIKPYNPKMQKHFSRIVSYSLEFEREVGVSLMKKYGCRMDFVGEQFILAYLFEKGRFDLLDAMIEKFSTIILRTVFVMRYYGTGHDEVIKYITKKRKVPLRSENGSKILEVILYDAVEKKYRINDVAKIKVNGLSIEEFVNSNEEYIECMKIVSTDGIFSEYRRKSNNWWEEDQQSFGNEDKELNSSDAESKIETLRGVVAPQTLLSDNVCTFEVIFDGKVKKYYLEWLGDDYFGKDFLQRTYYENDSYVWTYDNRFISNNIFASYVFEEKIKHDNNFDYDQKITMNDLQSISEVKLIIDSLMAFKAVELLIDDLNKIPQLKKLRLYFREYVVSEKPVEHNISSLSRLTRIESVEINVTGKNVVVVGDEKLVNAGIRVLHRHVDILIS